MIIAAHRLFRDRQDKTGSFGYERLLWGEQRSFDRRYVPMLGCPMMIETRLDQNMIKIVELYHRDEVIIIERLAWMFDNQIYPYRMRYIRPSNPHVIDIPIMFLPNMSAIYRKLSGIDVLFQSPLQFYLQNAVFGQFNTNPNDHVIYDVYQRYNTSLDNMAYQDVDHKSLKDFLAMIDVEQPLSNINGCMENAILPRLITPDLLSMRHMRKPLSSRNLVMTINRDNPYDTSPAKPLCINHPDVTQFSPKCHHAIARILDDISAQYTDVKLEYILHSDGSIDCQVHHLVSRYVDHPDEGVVAHLCFHVVNGMIHSYENSITQYQRQELIVSLELTYGEEALIEIYTPDRKNCLYAVHFDLAMIALCAASVLALSP